VDWQRSRRLPTRRKRSRSDRLVGGFERVEASPRRVWRFVPRRIPFAVLTVIFLYALGRLLIGSTFRIEHVSITGTHLTDPGTVDQFADLKGRNPFTVNSGAAAERVMNLGVYSDVHVTIQLPNEATIAVTEQTPAYIWKVDPTLYLVANDGTIIGPTATESERVIVVDADHQPVRIGQKVDPRILNEAAYLLAVLPSTTSLAPHYLLYSRAMGIMVPTNLGFTVVIGDDTNLQEKLQMLGATLHAAETATPRPSIVDVRFLPRPYFH